MEGARTEWTFALESVLPPSSWWGSRTTEAPRCGAGRFGAAFPWLSWVPPSPAHLAGTVWRCTRSRSPSGGSAASALGTMRLFLTVHALGFSAPTPRLPRRSRLSEGPADRRTCPNPGLLSQTRSDGMRFPHQENTWAFVRRASGKLPGSCICPVIYTLPKKADLQESERISKRWVGWAPSPNPCFPLILRNNRGCSHLPKTPSPEQGGRGAASWLNKAETPVCQKQADGDRPICAACFTRRLGWETHIWASRRFLWSWFSPVPCNSFAQHFSLPGLLSTQGWTCHAKTNLVHLKGLKGSCISGDISPAYLTHPAVLCGLEGHPERKAKPSSVFTEPLSSKACPPCDGCGSFAPARCALSVIQPENID